MKIKALTSFAGNGFSFRKDEEKEIDNKIGEDLIRATFAIEVKTAKKGAAKNEDK